jgi:DNA mismatch repair protein MutL
LPPKRRQQTVPDIIQLLPDHIANQIAAGEVIQRPASAVKELLENAIDAGATDIQLIVSDAGKGLVQVIDNGKGMSPTDARMAFERHATSKISTIEDLFRLRTMGFRGEALASIAAVAQVELKTRRHEEELGTFIRIENSVVVQQEPVQCPVGTSISMKNVFFNVPARRNFLKSNTTELRNIIDEFTRVAMAFPDVKFSLVSNGQQVFVLERGSLKQRIVQLLGSQYGSKLVPIKEDTDYLMVHGFVGKPDTARKTRGDQYFFINNRFIKSAYLNHAVTHAYENLLAKDSYPTYVLFIDLDPEHVDINVHPTKQEIKFDDEKIVYAFVQAAVKHALAQFSIAPSLDFTLNADIQQLDSVNKPVTDDIENRTISSSLYQSFTQKNQAHKIEPSGLRSWRDMQQQEEEIRKSVDRSKENVDGLQLTVERNANTGAEINPSTSNQQPSTESGWQSELAKLRDQLFEVSAKTPYYDFEHERRPVSREKRFQWIVDTPLMQIHGAYVIAITNHGYLLIHQQGAHERILYEQLQKALFGKPIATQQSLFPVTIQLQPADAVLLTELLADMQQLGYQVEPFGNHSFVIHGTPADVDSGNEQKAIEHIIEHYKNFNAEVKFSRREKLIRTLAWQQSIKSGRPLNEKEMRSVVEQLFLCAIPNTTPGGKPTYVEYSLDQLQRTFG